MNTAFAEHLRTNNTTDFRYMWRTKAKSATSCGNAFETNNLLVSVGTASISSSLQKHMLLRCFQLALFPLVSPYFTTIN